MDSMRFSSATATALKRQDILDEIFTYIKVPIDLSKNDYRYISSENLQYQRTLSAAARTCKAFNRPALKFLWQELPSLDALFCLSSSIQVVDPPRPWLTSHGVDRRTGRFQRYPSPSWQMKGVITESERRRFIFYTRYIRMIVLWTPLDIDDSVFQSLSVAGLFPHLFPQLHTIHCLPPSRDWLPRALRMLIRPAFRHLTLNIDQKHPRRQPKETWLLRTACLLAPQIESLVLGGNGPIPPLEELGQLKHLRTLHFFMTHASPQHHHTLIATLSSLEHLQELTLSDCCVPRDPVYLCMRLSAGFASLQKMTVVGGIQIVSRPYADLIDLRLRELCLDKLPREQLPLLEDLVRRCTSAFRKSLSVLRIKCGTQARGTRADRDGESKAPPAPFVQHIRPLLKLPNIVTLSFEAQDALLVDDEALLAIGHAWPQLASLDLHTAHAKSERAAPTIHGIVSLLRACPDLRDVYLPSIVTLDAHHTVEPPYVLTKNRWPPDSDILLDGAIEDVEVGRLVDVLWALFGVALPRMSPLSERWRTVLCTVAEVQDRWERPETCV